MDLRSEASISLDSALLEPTRANTVEADQNGKDSRFMQNRNFPVRVFGWLIGVFDVPCRRGGLGAATGFGVALGWGAGQCWVSVGCRVRGFWERAIVSRDSTPALPRRAPIDRLSCSFPQPCRRVRIPIPSRSRQAGRGRPIIKIDPSSDVSIGEFRSVEPPQIEHDEDAFPGLRLESHSGTVKWVATIQLPRACNRRR